jgi:hypothetical protein
MQDIREFQNGANGSAAGGVFVAGSGLANQNILPKVGPGFTYPGLDVLDPGDPTSVSGFTSTPNPPDGVTVHMDDSPETGWPANPDKLDAIDVKYSFRTYLVVLYPDETIYPIAYWDWEANCYATMNAPGLGVTWMEAASKVTAADSWVRSNADPLKTASPIFNYSIEWR